MRSCHRGCQQLGCRVRRILEVCKRAIRSEKVAKKGSIFAAAADQIAASRRGKAPDYRLSFESTRSLFSELTPARLDLMDTLRRVGPCSVNALAKSAGRNYSNVHTDVTRLEELGLITPSDDGGVLVPFESVEILFPLARVA